MDRKTYIILGAIAVLVLTGMGLSYSPNVYTSVFEANIDGNVISYDYDANYGMETHTVLIETDGLYDIKKIVACYDESYYSYITHREQSDALSNFSYYFMDCGLSEFSICDAETISNGISDYTVEDTAIMLVSGAIPSVLYDGTCNSPLVKWLDCGGTVINMFGPLGKYVSTDQSLIPVSGFSEIFTTVSDDSIFNDTSELVFGTIPDKSIQDSLNVYLNECTYGIHYDKLKGDYFAIGSQTENGLSSALIFKSRNGMVMNFASTVGNSPYILHHIVQVVASGLDYTAEILDYQSGNTYTDDSGSFITDAEHCHVYGYVGNIDAVYGKKIIIR